MDEMVEAHRGHCSGIDSIATVGYGDGSSAEFSSWIVR